MENLSSVSGINGCVNIWNGRGGSHASYGTGWNNGERTAIDSVKGIYAITSFWKIGRYLPHPNPTGIGLESCTIELSEGLREPVKLLTVKVI